MVDQQRLWDAEIAQSYDTPGEGMFSADVLTPPRARLDRC